MKYFLISIFIFLQICLRAQENFIWTEVVKVDSSLSQKELYSRAKLYIAQKYVSNKAVTQLNDDATYTIVIKPIHEIIPRVQGVGAAFTSLDAGYVRYTLTIVAKDGRYKYTVDQCSHEGIGPINDCGVLSSEKPRRNLWQGGLPPTFWAEKLKPDFITYTTALIDDLKLNMAKKSDKADW